MVRAARHSSSSLLNERNLATTGFALQMRQRHLLRRLQTIRTSARRMIFGSIVPQLEMLSVLEPPASWEGPPGPAGVAPSSLASRPVSVRFREPKLRSQLRDVMWTLAYAVDHGMRIDGRKAERGAAAEQTHNDSLLESAHCRRMLGYHRGQG